MNERIEEFAKDCKILGEKEFAGKVVGFNYKKFAELIVREAAKEAKKYADKSIYSDDYEDCGIECMPRDMENYVLHHFGVDE